MQIISRPYMMMLVLLTSLTWAVGISAADNSDLVPQFQGGDSVCFIGDSITHGGLYHSDVLLFYATRFPDRHFEAHNCGLSGDSAGGAVNRFSWDIGPHKPTIVTIMLGMNDVNRGIYGKDKTGPAIEKQRAAALDAYVANMAKLSGLLSAVGCKQVFILPSIYDQTGNQPTPCNYGVNDALGRCGQIGSTLASRVQGYVVDFYGPMTKINAAGQAKDPSFTLVGKDRVHPGEIGHLVMAYTFLKAQGMSATVSEMAINANTPSAIKQSNCTITGLKSDRGCIEFECLERALPLPVPDGAAKALEMVPLMDELNREMLVVTDLASGQYEILIDGQPVAQKSAAELAAGVNLASIKTTPQYKQALKVKELNDKRHLLISQKLRTIAAVQHFVINRADPKPSGAEGEQRTLDAQMEKNRKNKFDYGIMQIETYRKHKPSEQQIRAEAADAWKAMYLANQPRPHRFLVRPMTASKS